VRHIATTGEAPAEWAAILAEANREQDEADQQDIEVDHFFDAPLALAEALCGYRPDAEGPEREMTPLAKRRGPGLLARLFGSRA